MTDQVPENPVKVPEDNTDDTSLETPPVDEIHEDVQPDDPTAIPLDQEDRPDKNYREVNEDE